MQRVLLDAIGPNESYKKHQEAIEILRTRGSGPLTQLFAQYRSAGSSSEPAAWWTERQGHLVPLQSLSATDQAALLASWQQSLAKIPALIRELKQSGHTESAQLLQQFLSDEQLQGSLYSLNGAPLLALGGTDAQPIPAYQVAKSEPIAPIAAAAAPLTTTVASRPRRWPYVLAALLLLLLLLACLSWFFRWPTAWWDTIAPPVLPVIEQSQQELEPAPVVEPIPEAPVEPEPVIELVPDSSPEAPAMEVVEKPAAKPTLPANTHLPVCARDSQGKRLNPEFFIVFDTSGSMNLNINAKKADEDWYFSLSELERVLLTGENEQRAREIFGGTARITVARSAFRQMLDKLPKEQDVHLLTFTQECGPPKSWGNFSGARRGELKRIIDDVPIDNSTNLASSLAWAAARVDGVSRDALIVLFVDGADGCEQNICAIAQSIAKEKPRLKVNVVDITGQGLASCVASATGGRIVSPRQAAQVSSALHQATVQSIQEQAQCR
ncbi:vWA domain-containing protein [Alcaligenes endophyticus]|uniref:VWFA domain-containing protein n=1 Tax=Alcaligenes endophyticus TaxID=1929088 RepID=A0ABT8ELG5_9BURK|nr:hypothetical protein [Alcaligenes endophyticus]MCX5590594.1 hypothetical protein [Alcaligenes endophyticus]MDN4122042.1 hypothetical protein [Alcaligenes endophyticus]